jgi:hypothetical protein
MIRIERKRVKQPELLRSRMQRTGDAQRTRELEEDLRRDVAELKGHLEAKRRYAGMARQVINGFLQEIGQ